MGRGNRRAPSEEDEDVFFFLHGNHFSKRKKGLRWICCGVERWEEDRGLSHIFLKMVDSRQKK